MSPSLLRPRKLLAVAVAFAIGSCHGFATVGPQSSVSSISVTPTLNHPTKRSSSLQAHELVDSAMLLANAAPPEVAGISYSKASYYTVLGLYLMSFPGLWSQIKRSTVAKVKRKTFVAKGEKETDGMSLRQQAGEIMACTYGCYCGIVISHRSQT